MFNYFLFALALPCIFAQDLTSKAPSDQLLTGADKEYRKIVKGDLVKSPVAFRTYVENASNSSPLSYWHDIPLFSSEPDQIYNMVVEIPRGDALRTQIDTHLEMNPIDVDLDPVTKRPVMENVDYIHNFGKIPQTYLPTTEEKALMLPGTGLPLDVVEISDRTHAIGDVVPIKILGALAVNDNVTLEYKLIGFDVRASFASEIHTLQDVETHYPDLLAATRGYFRFYKFPQQVNEILFAGEYQNAEWTQKLIADKHQDWVNLIKMANPPANVSTVSVQKDAAHQADLQAWQKILSA